MTRPYSMSLNAIHKVIDREQTSGDALDVAEIIAVKFDVAISMSKQVGTEYQAKGEIRVKELGTQLCLLADWADAGYPDEYTSTFHIEETPLSMRLHNVDAKLLQEITDELAGKQSEWLGLDQQVASAYGDADLGTHVILSGGEVLELDAQKPEAGGDEDEHPY